MELETTRFGKIEIKEDEMILFNQGLYGFKNEKKFVILKEEESDFFWLQSSTNSDLAFIVTEPWNYIKYYEFDLNDELQKELNISSKEDVMVINIITVPENPKEMTINLKAPIVINYKERLAKQIILDDERYQIKHRLFYDENNKQVADNA
ncbi:flagellar assembly factor FliW [Orenia metallireducens]|jgi:flagellar assembly factor FliW|uniref:Flagellar assembly factor FliW n=1 Tax=Orenia metallireducens TaxID=1413210 RepID=A0A285GBE8_9FIRM|nr:flagellar assembly protein FliW [Orenia metallireducens]PRX32579.1 flagellar assembly factor FliW [Orenia metallireducens]SNY20785.1 flagellar assembly factor FliW [Orenia metallireducens]